MKIIAGKEVKYIFFHMEKDTNWKDSQSDDVHKR